jgi:bifunctional non-homologous end joining protein LigD
VSPRTERTVHTGRPFAGDGDGTRYPATMSLEQYRAKRDFAITPEPGGGPASSIGGLRRFVVQRHRASRLHYDVRLEIGGALVSWAVPRGPSLRPLERRRAARTEDHPIEYLDFEGTIPSGEYGAGDVIVWDHGTWDPELPGDTGAAVASGELKFVLYGRRLRGRFVLVRTATDRRGSEDWLLIHKDDEHADAEWDIEDHPTSVLSGRTNEAVAGGEPADIEPDRRIGDLDLSAAVDSTLPSFVEPMLATSTVHPFDDAGWLFEIKFDGYRVQAVVDGAGSLRLWTRNHKDAAAWFPAFAASRAHEWLAGGPVIVDGEMVALRDDGRPDFSLLQELSGTKGLGLRRRDRRPGRSAGAERERRTGAIVYHAFDLLHVDGWSLLDVGLWQRKRLLRLLLRPHPSVRYVSHVTEHGRAFHEAASQQGLEGSVAKLRDSRYEAGTRSRSWLKVKTRREQELVVVGYEPGTGRHADLGSLLVATHEADGWHFAGHVGSGIDARTRRDLRALLDESIREDPAVPGVPPSASARYVEPRHVIRAEFAEWTADRLLRQAVYKGLEPDRDPTTVSREAAIDAATASTGAPADRVSEGELAALDALGDGGSWAVGGHTVELSNLDKVLFPEAGFTKRDLVRYYTSIAPLLLPYLRERPLNVHRWPDGVDGSTHFWQKQIPSHAPDWVARWDHPEPGRARSQTYVVCDRVATLAWLANQAAIDLHPWTSRLPAWWRPTHALIDIDPGRDTTWEQVVTLARLYRTALQHLGVRGYPKVTGSRGIQVWINLQPRYTFDDTRDWVGSLSQRVGAVVPDLVSWEWSKAERGGRARLDYTQNALNKTLVAPYAVRPVARGAVSAPITWDELDDPRLHAQRWDLRTILERTAERGDLFAGVLADPQELPPID